MSVFGPMGSLYDISTIIKNGIMILSKNNKEPDEESVILEIRKRFKESVSDLDPLQVQEVMTYLEKIADNLGEIINRFAEISYFSEYFSKEQTTKEEETKIQLFVRNMFKDSDRCLESSINLISQGLRLVNIAKEEISVYLPKVLSNEDGIVLRKINNDINE